MPRSDTNETNLEVTWSGALERSGQALPLSGYCGGSSLGYDPNIETILEKRADRERQRRNRYIKCGRSYPGRRAKQGEYDERAIAMLQAGATYSVVSRNLGLSRSIVRRCAKHAGMDRTSWRGQRWIGARV